MRSAKDLTSALWTSMTSWMRAPAADLRRGDGDSSEDATIPNEAQEPELQEPDEPLPDQRIDRRYSAIRQIGKGGFGRVYLVKDEFQDGQEVALKVIHRKYCGTSEIEQRFRREIRVLRTIAHENVPQIYNDGKTELGELYFTMRYVPGRSLRELLLEEAPLTEERTLHIAIQIAEALAHAHFRGLVHRDLKPSNVQVTKLEDESERIALLDFGIAGLLQAPRQSGVDLTASLIGTPVYMAPERMRGRLATAAVDQYALGLVLYEMLSGKTPYFGSTPMEVQASKMRDARTNLGPYRASPGLTQLVEELVSNEPSVRPSAAATVVRLKELAGIETGPKASRKRIALVAGTLVGAVLAGLWIFKRPDPVTTGPGVDTEPPVIIAPKELPVPCDAGEAFATVNDYGAKASDNLDGTLDIEYIPPPGSRFRKDSPDVICRAIDKAGNRAREARIKIVVTDTQRPTIELPTRKDWPCDPKTNFATISDFGAKANDNCDGALTVRADSTGPFELGPNSVTFHATDSSGNPWSLPFKFTVVDEEAPEIGAPIETEFPCEEDKNTALVTLEMLGVVVTDNVDVGLVPTCQQLTSPLTIGPNPVTLEAVDKAGRRAQRTFTIDIKDIWDPKFEPQAPVEILCTRGNEVSVTDYPVKATDNDPREPTLSFKRKTGAGTYFGIGSHIIQATATDFTGRTASMEFELRVLDRVAPIIRLRPGPYRQTIPAGAVKIPVDFKQFVLVDDNWDQHVEPKFVPESTEFGPSLVTVQVDAEDSAGNKATTLTFDVSIVQAEGAERDDTLTIFDKEGRPTRWRALTSGHATIHFTGARELRPSATSIIVPVESRYRDGRAPIPSRMMLVAGIVSELSPGIGPFLIDEHEMSEAMVTLLDGRGEGSTEANLAALRLTRSKAQQLSMLAGKCLPTNLEWSLAAQGAGKAKRKYPWGDQYEAVDLISYLDTKPYVQRLDANPRDASIFGVVGMFSGAREWADSSNGESAFLMGPSLADLLKGKLSTHAERFKANKQVYENRLSQTTHAFSPTDPFDDAALRCVVRLTQLN